ncbi:MAG TPA: secondary thiamine-phosphate synthase enzyme YjbQ [Anaeromyxobacter sp.]|nr:secondary thiamine-phosphate synthase enzyme YjbQ [Anaeromyxobacter sp.]
MSSGFEVATRARVQMVDVTPEVRAALRASGVVDGLCVVFVPHTTAAVTIQENSDPDVQRDVVAALARMVPDDPPGAGYRHLEGNSPAHVKASLLGNSVAVPVEGGELALGTWQGIYLFELDGPRSRRVRVSIVSG